MLMLNKIYSRSELLEGGRQCAEYENMFLLTFFEIHFLSFARMLAFGIFRLHI